MNIFKCMLFINDFISLEKKNITIILSKIKNLIIGFWYQKSIHEDFYGFRRKDNL